MSRVVSGTAIRLTRRLEDERETGALCPLGNATLSGTYLLYGEGTIVGVGPLAVVGWLTYDGKGNVVKGSMTASMNGAISMFTVSGPYTVNSDCSGSVEPSGQHYNMVG